MDNNEKHLTIKLPDNWEWATIGDVCLKPQYGFTTKAVTNGNIKLLRTTDITTGEINWDAVPFCAQKPDDLNRYLLRDGDIVISRAGSVGFSMLIQKPIESIFASYLIRFKTLINKKFLYFFLKSPFYWKEIFDSRSGIALANVNAKKLQAIPLPLPPLSEQHRIVEKIERLFAELDKAVEELKKAKKKLELYRQSLLKAAFEGRLTEKWRREHANELESADELLARIKAEREKRYKQQLEEWKQAVKEWEAQGKPGKKPKKPRKPKEVPPLTEEELAELPKLPRGWGWHRLGLMTTGVEYGTSSKSEKRGKVPVLRMGNIQNFTFDWSDLVYSNNDDEIKKFILKKGDVLFNRTNSPELVGKSAIFWEERKAIFAGYLIRINQISSIVESKFLNFFLNSPYAKFHGNKVKTDGVNQSNISGDKLINYPFPYCSLHEQKEIVEQLDSYFSTLDHLSQTITKSLARAEALRQSILKKAFTGKLVPQDPNDEPASELLKRIRAEREKEAPKAKRKRRRWSK